MGGAAANAGVEWRAKVECLSRQEQLDREYLTKVTGDLPRLERRARTHGVVVLLPARRGNRVNAGGMAPSLALRHEAGRDVLRDHVARVQPAARREKCRQAFVRERVHQTIDPPLGDTGQLRHADGERVERESQRLAVEVPSRQNHAVIREQQRVVRDAVDLTLEYLPREADRLARGAVDLGHAAETV